MKKVVLSAISPLHLKHFFFLPAFFLFADHLAAHSARSSDSIPEPIYTKVEFMPSFPGGASALKEYFDFNLGYITSPPSGVEKQVMVQFIVGKEGTIRDVEVTQGFNESTNRKALTLISNMPRWLPGLDEGIPVAVQIDLPVLFYVPGAKFEAVKTCPKESATSTPQELEEPVFKVVENMPAFPDGQYALLQFLAENIEFPADAKEKEIQGMVVIQFIVEKDGSLTNHKVVKGILASCDNEALRVTTLMPKWIPGKQRGKPVRVQFNLPIRYKLE